MTINGAEVEKADIEASNGIIHIMEETIDPIPTGNIAEVVSTDHRCALLYKIERRDEMGEVERERGM